MADLVWPADLAPYSCMFYLQPNIGGQESPLTLVRKTYERTAPRWVARLTFRGGYNGRVRWGSPEGFGPRLDSLIADLNGGANLALFHDWRRPVPTTPISIRTALTVAEDAPKGATSVKVAGFAAGSIALSAGDYLGGDGRPHIASVERTLDAGGVVSGAGSIIADASGVATIGFRPALAIDLPAGTPIKWPVIGRFQLTDNDAGQNETEVGDATPYTLDFVEYLG